MRLRHLRYFIVVAEELSFTKASARLHIEPSPLSRAIRDAEARFVGDEGLLSSAELSEFAFAAGVKLLGEFKPDLMYLTTTDFVQHTQALGINQSSVSLRISALEQKLGIAPFDRNRRGVRLRRPAMNGSKECRGIR